LIVINNPIFERMTIDNNSMMFNIVSDSIEYYPHPVSYIRRTKIQKIKKDIDARKKSRSSSNQGVQI
jgi:transposase